MAIFNSYFDITRGYPYHIRQTSPWDDHTVPGSCGLRPLRGGNEGRNSFDAGEMVVWNRESYEKLIDPIS